MNDSKDISNDISRLKYVLVTPAKNEEAFIEMTIRSVIKQTVLPQKWAIVNDGSTDRTAEIVRRYSSEYEFIQLISIGECSTRNFASKVNAFNIGYRTIRHVKHAFLGNLDADISFQSNYFERILQKNLLDDRLGISGGIIYDFCDGAFRKQQSGLNSVAGAVQFFRKECFEEIGGYIPIKYGLIDAVAEVSARINGWKTHSFPELKVFHYRLTSSQGRNKFSIALRQGELDYMFGVHPIFQFGRSVQRSLKKPIAIGTLLRLFKYWLCFLEKKSRPVSDEFVRYLRCEEKEKLKAFLFRKKLDLRCSQYLNRTR